VLLTAAHAIRAGQLAIVGLAAIMATSCEGREVLPTAMVRVAPAPKRVAPAAPVRVRVATWNVAWLRAEEGAGTIKRTAEDFARLRSYAEGLDVDVVALQEVDGPEAAARLFDPQVYALEFEEGEDVQRVGFAIRRPLAVERHPDLAELDVGYLRAGVDLTVTVGAARMRLLAVHLKSGCFGPALTGKKACIKLARQLPILEAWVDARAAEETPFLVLGDFNRRFEPPDSFWPELDDGEPRNADLTSVNEGLSSDCWASKYPKPIDHLLFGRRAARWIVPGTRHVHLFDAPGDDRRRRTLSDHCALSVELEIQ